MISSHGLRSVVTTAAFLLVGLVLTLVTGVVIARSLGDSGRGAYALVVTWYGISAMVAEWGQSGGVTFFVARAPHNGAEGVSSARMVMLGPSLAVALIGAGLSRHLAHGDPALTWCYIVAFSMPLATALAGAYLFAAQALSIVAWNAIRIVQPMVYLVLVLLTSLTGRVTVASVTGCFAASLVGQMSCAWIFGARRGLTGGSPRREDAAWLAGFGIRQMGSTIPAALSGSLDKIVLASFVSSAVIGHYAIAYSVIGTTGTLSAAISAVSYPRLASLPLSAPGRIRFEVRALAGAGLSTAVFGAVISAASPWVIPYIYGAEFADSVDLVWWCLPAVVLTSMDIVAAAILRGRGLPGRVATAHVVGLAVTIFLLVLLVPRWGAVGAAMSLAGAAAVTVCALLYLWLRSASVGSHSDDGVP